MSLLQALGIGRGDVVSAVGAGGKTSLVYSLARAARAAGLRALVTTTTHMGRLPEAVTGPVFVESEDGAAGLLEALRAEGRATLLGRRLRDDKIEGIAPERVDALAGCADLVLVEADGARQRSLKVPAPHEPVVPRSTTLVLVLAALDVLGRPLDAEAVHRLERVTAATGRAAGSPLDEDVIVAALCHPDGYLARIPGAARRAVFLNKAEDPATRAAAARLAARLAPPFDFVAAGSARTGEVVVFR